MKFNFRALLAQIRASFGQDPRPLVFGNQETRRSLSFRPEVEQLEGRVVPSTSGIQGSEVYNTLLKSADHIEIAVVNAAQAALTNSQTVDQAIGVPFLQGIANQLTTDLAPLAQINFGSQLDGLFGAGNDVQFGQKACNFIRDCLQRKIFAGCATQAADGGSVIGGDFANPIILADLPGAIVYATAYTRICDQIYTCEISPCVQEFSCDVYDGNLPDFENAPLELQNCVSSGESLVPPILQSEEQSLEQFSADPNSVTGISQTPALQFNNADGSIASNTVFNLSANGAAENSSSVFYDAFGAPMGNVKSDYATNGIVSDQVVIFLNADGLIGSQDITIYKLDGAVALSIVSADSEGADGTLTSSQGTVTDGNGNLVNSFALTNTENADGTLTNSSNSTSDANGAQDGSATVTYDSAGQSLTVLTATDYANNVADGITAVDDNGNYVDTSSGGDSGGSGGDSGGGDSGGSGGDFGGGDFGGGGAGDSGGSGGDSGGGDSGGGDWGGDTGGGDSGGDWGGDTGGDTGGGDWGGDFSFAGAAMMAAPAHASAFVNSAPPYAGVVTTFSGSDPNPADYAAIILWGDGTGSAGVVSAAGFGKFKVWGTHGSAPVVNAPLFVSVTNVVNGDQILAAKPATLPFTDSFNGLGFGNSWATEGGSFAVVNNQAMALNLNTPNVAVLKGVSAADVSESVGVTNLLTGVTASLVARYQGPGINGLLGQTKFYYAGITHTFTGYTASIYKNVGGVATLLTSASVPTSVFNGTGTLTFRVVGSSLRLIVTKGNGVPTLVAFASDSSIPTPGTVGLWGTIAAQFNNFSAQPMAPTIPSLSPSFTDTLTSTSDGQLNSNWNNPLGDFARNAAGNLAGISLAPASVAVLNGIAVANVSESVVVTSLLSGQSAGLVARYKGSGNANYYLGAISRSGNVFTAQIYKNVSGVWTLLASTPVSSTVFNGSGTIQFEAEGPSLRLLAMKIGTPTVVVQATDASISGPGSVGIYGTAGAQLNTFGANAVTLTTPSISPSFTDDFAATPDGQLNRNWVNQSGDFVRNASGNMTAISATPNVAVLNGVVAANVVESVTVTNLLSGQLAALIARYQGPANANLYEGAISRSGNTFTAYLYKNIGGAWTQLASVPVAASLFNGSGTIQFELAGPSLRLFLVRSPGTLVPLVVAWDASISAPGSVGIIGSAGTQFSHFNVNTVTLTTPIVAPAFTESFAATPDGQLNGNWLNLAGNFGVINGAALGQMGGSNIAVLNGVNIADDSTQVNIDLTAVNLAANSYAGLTVRSVGLVNGSKYVGFVMKLANGKLQPYIERVVGGVWTILTSGATIANSAGTLTFQVEGPSLKLFLNGKLISFAQDTALKTGSVGLLASQAVAEMNFQVSPIVVPQQTTFSDQFSTPALGNQLSTNWIERSGNFTVNPGSAVGQANVNLATVVNFGALNATVQANVSFTAASQFFGLLARYAGPSDANAYQAQLVSLGAGKMQANLLKNVGGSWISLASKTIANFAGGLKFQVNGNTLSLTIDGKLILSITDKSITAVGMIGLRTSSGVAINGFNATGN